MLSLPAIPVTNPHRTLAGPSFHEHRHRHRDEGALKCQVVVQILLLYLSRIRRLWTLWKSGRACAACGETWGQAGRRVLWQPARLIQLQVVGTVNRNCPHAERLLFPKSTGGCPG